MAKLDDVMSQLEALSNPENVSGMAKFGIDPTNTLGISIYDLRKIAKILGADHKLAGQLWSTGIHEARILASYVEDPKKVSNAQLEQWVSDFNSWDVCDQVVELFSRTPYAYQKIIAWSTRPEEFVKRAAFALIAELAAHDKQAADADFEQFFPLIVREATDERNYVKKAVNWALRNIGKRNLALNAGAIETAHVIQTIDNRSAHWIAADALRELTSDAVQVRLRTRK